jgi:hypothetical protein
MFSQHPHVDIFNVPTAHNLLDSLRTRSMPAVLLGLPADVPLKDVTLLASLGADNSIEHQYCVKSYLILVDNCVMRNEPPELMRKDPP